MLDMAPGTVRVKVSTLLKSRGMTVGELSERAGIHYNTALALKRGVFTRLDLDTLARVCDALGVQVSDILEYDPSRDLEPG
jgi:putative transcriptional regulator